MSVRAVNLHPVHLLIASDHFPLFHICKWPPCNWHVGVSIGVSINLRKVYQPFRVRGPHYVATAAFVDTLDARSACRMNQGVKGSGVSEALSKTLEIGGNKWAIRSSDRPHSTSSSTHFWSFFQYTYIHLAYCSLSLGNYRSMAYSLPPKILQFKKQSHYLLLCLYNVAAAALQKIAIGLPKCISDLQSKRFFLDFDCQITHGMSQLNVIMGRRFAATPAVRCFSSSGACYAVTRLQNREALAASGIVTHYDSSYRKIQGEGAPTAF